MVKALLALVPSLGVLFLFVVVVKSMLEGDRRERVAQAKWDKEQDVAALAAASAEPAQRSTETVDRSGPPAADRG